MGKTQSKLFSSKNVKFDTQGNEVAINASTTGTAPRRNSSAREGSVTTPQGSRRFGSFAGKFVLQYVDGQSRPRPPVEDFDGQNENQLRSGAARMRQELDSIYKAVAIMNQLALELDINKAVDNVRDVVLELLHCERVTLFMVDSQQKELRARVSNPNEVFEMIRIPFGVGIAGRVAETGTSMNIMDAYHCDLFNPSIDKKTGFTTRNILCCPISDMSGNHVAVIQALNKKDGYFTTGDEANLELFGVHLGNTLSKSRFHTTALAEKQRMGKLYEAFRHINTAGTTLDQLVSIILRAVHQLVYAERSMLLFVDQARDHLWTKWFRGTALDNKDISMVVKLNESNLLTRVAQTNEGICQHNVLTGEVASVIGSVMGIQSAKSVLIQPILDVRNGKCLAMVCAMDKSEQIENAFFSDPNFNSGDQNAIAVFAMEVATILSERSLEISFASALSTVTATGGSAAAGDLDQVLEAQLMSYVGNEDIESIASSISRSLSNKRSPSHSTRCSMEQSPGDAPQLVAQSLSASLSQQKPSPKKEAQRLALNREQLRRWDLDICAYTTEDLLKLVYDIFADSGVVEHFHLDERKLMSFIAAVCSHYHANPYHNFCHVVYVLHGCYMIMMTTEANKCLTRVDQLVLLISALCHDIDHDGHTNSFHINTNSPLAQRYNDLSVMENHHCAITFAILAKRDCSLLDHLDKPLRQEIRRLIIAGILATDMTFHFSLTTDFKNHSNFSIEKEDERLLLVKSILHAADISNPVRTFIVNCNMSHRVHNEFRLQVSEERKLGITPMLHMDAKDERVQCQLESNFIDFVVTPLWEHMALRFPGLQVCLDQIRANRDAYKQLAERTPTAIAAAMKRALANPKTADAASIQAWALQCEQEELQAVAATIKLPNSATSAGSAAAEPAATTAPAPEQVLPASGPGSVPSTGGVGERERGAGEAELASVSRASTQKSLNGGSSRASSLDATSSSVVSSGGIRLAQGDEA